MGTGEEAWERSRQDFFLEFSSGLAYTVKEKVCVYESPETKGASIDMSEQKRKPIPIGYEDIREVVRAGYYYVD